MEPNQNLNQSNPTNRTDNPEPTTQIEPKELKDLHSKLFATPPEAQNNKSSMSNEVSNETSDLPELHTLGHKNEYKLKKLVYIFSSVLVFLLIILGVSLYKGDIYWVRDLFGMGLPKDPIKATEKASSNMSKVKTYKSSFNADLSMEADSDQISGKLVGSGDFDEASGQSKLTFEIKDIKMPKTKDDALNKSFEALEQNPKIEGSVVATKNEVYFKSPSMGDKWYRMDIQGFANPEKLTKESNQDLSKMFGAAIYSNGIQTTGYDSLGKYVKSAKKTNDEKIDGEGVYHYVLELDLIKALEENEAYKAMPDFYKETYKNFISKYVSIKMDFYISRKTLLIKKQAIDFDMRFNMEDFGGSGVVKYKIKFDNKINDINKPVAIEKPLDAIDFDKNTLLKLFGLDSLVPGSGTGSDSQIKFRDTRRKSDLKQIQTALELYADNNSGKYPVAISDSRNSSFLSVLTPNYMAKVPSDPSHPNYYYKYESDGTKYKLTCVLENQNDTEGKKSGNYNIYTLQSP